jgi:hypothetical protein
MKTSVRVSLILMTLPLVLACCTTLAEREAHPVGSPPVITHSFASKEVSHGDVWRIYVEANDPDGDMRYFAYTIRTSGLGGRGDYVYIRKTDRAEMSGYLGVFVAPPQDAIGEWASFTLTLHIRDRSGNTSDNVAFPVALSRGVKQDSPPPPFDSEGLKSLGRISVAFHGPRGGP